MFSDLKTNSVSFIQFDPLRAWFYFYRDAGLFGPDYAWVTVNDISDQLRQKKGVKEYDGLIMVDNGWELNGYEPFDRFLSEWMTLNPQE